MRSRPLRIPPGADLRHAVEALATVELLLAAPAEGQMRREPDAATGCLELVVRCAPAVGDPRDSGLPEGGDLDAPEAPRGR